MITALSNTLKKYANGWVVLTFFALTLIFAVFIVPPVEASLKAISGGAGPLDLSFSYTPEKAYAVIQSFGDKGRAIYQNFASTSDVLYPVVYGLFFCLLITWLFQRGFASDSKMQLLNVVPLGAWLFDWFENFNLVTMLSRYPEKSETIAWLASTGTSIKWIFGGLGTLLVLIGFVMAAKNKFNLKA